MRVASHRRFTEPMIKREDRGDPVIDPDTNEPKTIAFIPRSIRSKNLCRSSADVNEDLRIIDALKAAQDDHKAYKSKMTEHKKIISGLEIKISKERLTQKFVKTLFLFAQTLGIKMTHYKTTREQVPPPSKPSRTMQPSL